MTRKRAILSVVFLTAAILVGLRLAHGAEPAKPQTPLRPEACQTAPSGLRMTCDRGRDAPLLCERRPGGPWECAETRAKAPLDWAAPAPLGSSVPRRR